jgi:3D (Asp-Asp-Asp) domain-containing protein
VNDRPIGSAVSIADAPAHDTVRGSTLLRSCFSASLFAVVSLALGALIPTPAVAAEELQAGQSAIVTGTEGRGLRVRSGPGMGHKIVTTATEGATVQVVAGPVSDGEDDWYQISVGTSTTGWGIGRYLTSSTAVKAMSNADGQRMFIAKVTAYADGIGGVPLGAKTYSGTKTRWGVVAVDPKVIPIGSVLLIDGYEGTMFIAEDVGGGIKGETIDIWLPDLKEAKTYGTQYRRITIIREGPSR